MVRAWIDHGSRCLSEQHIKRIWLRRSGGMKIMHAHRGQARDQVFKGTDITPSDVRVHVRGTSAFVTCTEEVQAPSGAERRMLATNIYRKLEGRWVLVHHHASQAMVRGNSIEDLLGGASSARVIRIDGSLRDSDGASGKADSSADDIVDEIVRALQVCSL